MLATIVHFLAYVTVASPTLRAVISLAEVLVLGLALYWLWELALGLAGRSGKGDQKASKA